MMAHETMERVRVKTTDILFKLEENFARHKRELAAAQVAYLTAARAEVTKKLAALDAGEALALDFPLSPPDDHTQDYERAIAMLTMSQDEFTTVTAAQFAAFVQDVWSWKQTFLVKNASYASFGPGR